MIEQWRSRFVPSGAAVIPNRAREEAATECASDRKEAAVDCARYRNVPIDIGTKKRLEEFAHRE